MFGDIGQMAACLPGASLTGHPTPEHVEGVIRVKLGPISAGFRGAARIERDLNTMSGRIVGTGDDQRSRSSAQGEIRYRLVPIEQGIATRVELSIGYRLQGILAQIAREGLVRGLAARLTTEFASNVELQLSGNVVSGPTRQTNASTASRSHSTNFGCLCANSFEGPGTANGSRTFATSYPSQPGSQD
jgi:carbon-monoxide dehydrogenase small subunit